LTPSLSHICSFHVQDVSHTSGQYPVASRVVFIDGKPARQLYRIFNIRRELGGDDYASLEEVLERRFRRLKKMGKGNMLNSDDQSWSCPDLVVIDGGKGQLTAAIKGMEKANFRSQRIVSLNEDSQSPDIENDNEIPVCAIAKNEELIYVPGRDEPVNQATDSASPALLLVRALRDESHRFAVSAHRKRRSLRKSIKS
jgi:excinuclease ABC subunit C